MKTFHFGCLLVALPLLGCPPPAQETSDQPAPPPTQLVLKTVGEAPDPAKVGEFVDVSLGFGPGNDSSLFGAMIGDASNDQLTQWHLEPEGLAELDPVTNRVTFNAPGTIRLWASWTSPNQEEFRSNVLEITIQGEPGTQPE